MSRDLPAEMTLLMMTPIGVPLYSARGLVQTLSMDPLAKPAPRRTTNGQARFLGASQMRKYNSTITCTDQNAPAFDGLFPGDDIIVDCVRELAYKTGGTAQRAMVPGTTTRVVGAYTYYYPRIEFLVADWDDSYDEYKAEYQWRLSLVEK